MRGLFERDYLVGAVRPTAAWRADAAEAFARLGVARGAKLAQQVRLAAPRLSCEGLGGKGG